MATRARPTSSNGWGWWIFGTFGSISTLLGKAAAPTWLGVANLVPQSIGAVLVTCTHIIIRLAISQCLSLPAYIDLSYYYIPLYMIYIYIYPFYTITIISHYIIWLLLASRCAKPFLSCREELLLHAEFEGASPEVGRVVCIFWPCLPLLSMSQDLILWAPQ